MRKLIVGCCLVSSFVGCSSDEGEDPSTPSGGSQSNTGGAANGGGGSKATGGSPTGGTTMAGAPGTGGRATGGRAGTGGATTGGRVNGSGGGATGGAPTAPAGPVDTCNGESCPLGECDNGGFFADEKCSDVYSAPVDEDSTYCAGDGGYCLTTITNVLTRWAITCSAGTPMFDWCETGCLVAGQAAACQ